MEHQVVAPDGPAALLQRAPAHRVSPRARWMWASGELVSSVVLSAAVIWLHTTGWVPRPWSTLLLVVVLAESVLSVVAVPLWRYRVHRWEVTADAVYTQRGWLYQERRVAPIPRIQTVDTQRGPLAQLFKLASVTVTTASAKGELRIDGLDRADADRLAQELTAIAAADGGDGT
ncbi:PH domain-containing protein [Calidifontibacter terrae]